MSWIVWPLDHSRMSRIIWLFSKTSPVGILIVFIFAGCALVDFFTNFDNAIARWLCSALFVLYWPYFLCATILTDSELTDRDRDYLVFTGGLGFLAVTAGCLCDHFFPDFAQHRTYGNVPD